MCVFVSRPMKIALFFGKNGDPQNGLLISLGKETHSETKSWKSSRILRLNPSFSFFFLFSPFSPFSFFHFFHFFHFFIFSFFLIFFIFFLFVIFPFFHFFFYLFFVFFLSFFLFFFRHLQLLLLLFGTPLNACVCTLRITRTCKLTANSKHADLETWACATPTINPPRSWDEYDRQHHHADCTASFCNQH